jgi:hypothetical protein
MSEPMTRAAVPRPPKIQASPGPRRRGRRVGLLVLGAGAVPILAVGASVLLIPPLRPNEAAPTPIARPSEVAVEAAEARIDALEWPESPLGGVEAKRLLLDVVRAAEERLEAASGYTAILRRQERVEGKLGPLQTLQMKVRHRPFAIYLKFLDHDVGKEVVYAEGFHDNHVVGHGGGLTRLLLPYLKTAPTSALALRGNRHPITEAGLLNLTRKLVGFRELDLRDEEAETVLDRVTDSQGRTWLRSVHTHPHHQPERPFAYVEVLYDPATKLPAQISGFDWPAPGQTGPLLLGERYTYEDVVLDAPLTDLDFDPANPAYNFKRF